MASILTRVGRADNVAIHKYQADTEEDMYAIDLQGVPMGSTCMVINTSKRYKLNSQGEWIAISGFGSGSGGSELSDIDVLEVLIATNMLHAVADGDGALLTDENGNVLLW